MNMKKRTVITVTILLISIMIAGGSMAWFTSNSSKAVNELQFGTIKVKILEEFNDINGIDEKTYNKKVQIKNLGTKKAYVRVRLVPEWSEPSLPVSNVVLNLSANGDWTARQSDGYYYFKYYLTENDTTSLLLDSVTFSELGSEYKDASFTLKVVSEGVQTTHEAWKDIWGLNSLPFTPGQPWTP